MARATFDQDQGTVSVGRWTWPAQWIRRTDGFWGQRGGLVALLKVRRDVGLVVQGDTNRKQLWVELWTGDPESSDGAAVLIGKNGLPAIATVPLCDCGERGCGNLGVQLAAEISAENLPRLVRLLQELGMTVQLPTRANVWSGAFESGSPALTSGSSKRR